MAPRSALALALTAVLACGGSTPLPTQPPPVQLAPVTTGVPPAVPSAAAPSLAENEDDAAVPISPRNPTWGNRTARVTIVEFADFQCPFCGRAESSLAALREKYGPDDLRIVWKNSPLDMHREARAAAIAAVGVFQLGGALAFWKFHDQLFANQQDLTTENFVRWATDAGVTDLGAFRSGLASGPWADVVDADLRDGKSAGVQGTPTFFINGVFVNGAQNLEKFTSVIDAELRKAQARIDAGTPRTRVYAEMARLNHVAAPKADEGSEDKEDTTTVYKIPLGSSPVRGKPTALVTIVEFSDFQCPYCARVEPTLDALRAKYGDDLRIVWKNEPLPFHPQAEPAAQAALEVRAEKGDQAFWLMHDKLFAAQGTLSADVIARIASDVGASEAKVRAAMSGHTRKAEIAVDQDVEDDFQVAGTPNFFIDGRHMVGAQPQENFEAIIDEEIRKAKALLAKGTAAARVYDELTKDGKGPPPLETKDVPSSLPMTDPARGNPAAKVVVHEWADFQCPYCSRVLPTLEELMKDYGARIKFVWHDLPLPFHKDAELAAEAAREAYRQRGAGAFFTLHDKLFSNQKHLQRGDLDGYARALGLDMQSWAKALDGGRHASEVAASAASAKASGIEGTPGFLVVAGSARRGYFVNGAQTYHHFRKAVEAALADAK
jgi:protein-disulfide isomerase